MNDGFSMLDSYKLSRLLPDTPAGDLSIRFLAENMGMECTLRASKGVPYEQEVAMETILRLVAVDAAYRVMRLAEDCPRQRCCLAELVRLSHLYAHGEIPLSILEAALWNASETLMSNDHSLSFPAAYVAKRSIFLSATQDVRDSLAEAETAFGTHHQTVANTYFHEGRHGLLQAWKLGGYISFGAMFGVRSAHIIAVAETEIWHVAYGVADALIEMNNSAKVKIPARELRAFMTEAFQDTAIAIAEHVIRNGAERIVEEISGTRRYGEAKSQAEEAALAFFRRHDPVHEVFERMAVGNVALTAINWDFDEYETYAIGEAMLALKQSPFIEDHPANEQAEEIASLIVKEAMRGLDMRRLASGIANTIAARQESKTQANVLTRLLDDFASQPQ